MICSSTEHGSDAVSQTWRGAGSPAQAGAARMRAHTPAAPRRGRRKCWRRASPLAASRSRRGTWPGRLRQAGGARAQARAQAGPSFKQGSADVAPAEDLSEPRQWLRAPCARSPRCPGLCTTPRPCGRRGRAARLQRRASGRCLTSAAHAHVGGADDDHQNARQGREWRRARGPGRSRRAHGAGKLASGQRPCATACDGAGRAAGAAGERREARHGTRGSLQVKQAAHAYLASGPALTLPPAASAALNAPAFAHSPCTCLHAQLLLACPA